jgi:hypothetical protein
MKLPGFLSLVWAAVVIVGGVPYATGLSIGNTHHSGNTTRGLELQNSDKPVPKSDAIIRRSDHAKKLSLWNKAVSKGEQLLGEMRATDEERPELRSEWQGNLREELEISGWEDNDDPDGPEDDSDEDPDDSDPCDFELTWGNHKELKLLGQSAGIRDGLSTTSKEDGGENECFNILQVDTNGRYKGAVNQRQGVIFVQYAANPAWEVEQSRGSKPTEDELPALRTAADIFWGYWYRDNAFNLANIRYFWVQGVSNPSLIYMALDRTGAQRNLNWPGVNFELDTEEGKALLGSTNGRFAGHFLASHKKELGLKTVSKVQVFTYEGMELYDMILHVKDLSVESDEGNGRVRGPISLDDMEMYNSEDYMKDEPSSPGDEDEDLSDFEDMMEMDS